MDISLREWLIIGGMLIVVLILIDGWRRVSANRNRLRLEIDRTLSELGEAEPSQHNPELPNGGARRRSQESVRETPTQKPAAAKPERAATTPPQPVRREPVFNESITSQTREAAIECHGGTGRA